MEVRLPRLSPPPSQTRSPEQVQLNLGDPGRDKALGDRLPFMEVLRWAW